MSHSTRFLVPATPAVLLIGAALAGGGADTRDNPPPPAKAAAQKEDGAAKGGPARPPHKVERGPIKVEVTLKGVFEAKQMAELALRPEVWTELMVAEAVEQGTEVKKGSPLVTLETKKIDEAIRELETGRSLAELSIKQAQEEVRILDASLPQDLAAAEQSKRIADEDLRRFQEVDRPLSLKSAAFSLKAATNNLEYQTEELRQLEKMYKTDDLTEETEEIILKRQKDVVEQSTFSLERAKNFHDQAVKVDVPRRGETLDENARKQALALDKAKTLLPMALNKKRLDLEKMVHDQEKAAERLEKLRKDRAAMAVLSPADGVVYYGKCVAGNWPTSATVAARMNRGGLVQPHEVFMTVVQPRPLFIRASAPEKELEHLRVALEGRATPAGYPDLVLPARIDKLSAVPSPPGSFEVRLSVEPGEKEAALMPGMTCTVLLKAYAKQDALTIPVGAIFTDELDDQKKFVYRVKEGGHEKRAIRVGKKTELKAEVLEGLEEGDEALPENPEKKGSAPGGTP